MHRLGKAGANCIRLVRPRRQFSTGVVESFGCHICIAFVIVDPVSKLNVSEEVVIISSSFFPILVGDRNVDKSGDIGVYHNITILIYLVLIRDLRCAASPVMGH